MIETSLENHRNGLEKVLNLVLRKVWEPCKQNVTPMLTYNPNDNWPWFLVVEAADGNPKPLTDRIDVFAWHKAVEGMGGSYKSIKPMNDSRQLLVHFDNKAYSDILRRTDKLIDIAVKVTAHRALNSSRCVIGCKELRNVDEEDIKDKLQSQGVTKVECMKSRKDGLLVPSDSYILTINSPNIPPQIKVDFLICNTKVYIPNPQRCFNCQKYGHNKRFCKNEPKCAKCGQAGHEDHECENEAKCANCNGDHPAYVRSCPKWKIEKEIMKVKYQKNIPFHEARQQVEGPVTDTSKNSYATVSKSHQWTSNIKAPNTLKTEEEWLTHTIDSLLKRLDAIKKSMDPVLKLDNDHIQFVKEAKFLGLIWDTKLTFEPHIKYLKARCQKSLNTLKVLSRTEWGADRTTLLKLYRSLVRSKLDYGIIVYGSAS